MAHTSVRPGYTIGDIAKIISNGSHLGIGTVLSGFILSTSSPLIDRYDILIIFASFIVDVLYRRIYSVCLRHKADLHLGSEQKADDVKSGPDSDVLLLKLDSPKHQSSVRESSTVTHLPTPAQVQSAAKELALQCANKRKQEWEKELGLLSIKLGQTAVMAKVTELQAPTAPTSSSEAAWESLSDSNNFADSESTPVSASFQQHSYQRSREWAREMGTLSIKNWQAEQMAGAASERQKPRSSRASASSKVLWDVADESDRFADSKFTSVDGSNGESGGGKKTYFFKKEMTDQTQDEKYERTLLFKWTNKNT
ncbi:hypothetical protein MMC28_010454 [Mycoblastus sanguinarius]|nr:hypothetical protein [Mycoblastus sanguinarius]